MIRQKLRAVAVICVVWLLVAAWHPFSLGFFSDDWSLFVPTVSDQFIAELVEQYPNYPRILLQTGIHPSIIAARPGYAFALYCLKIVLSDSPFHWQSASALLLLAAAFTVYFLALELLRQYEYKQNECQFGATVAACVYLIGPWSIVMGAWPTAAITLVSQIFVVIGLTKLVSNQTKRPLGAALFMLTGFLVYESYWLLAAPVLVILWGTDRWSMRECIRLLWIFFGVLAIAIFIKSGLSRAWGIPGKAITTDFFPMFLQNITAYPRVFGDALHPVPFKYFSAVVLALVSFSFALEGGAYRRVGGLFGSLFVGLASSALLYAVVGYGISGTGVMARTLAAQNLYFSLFIGISMMPALTKLRSLQIDNFSGAAHALRSRDVFLPLLWCAFAILVLALSAAMAKRSNEWSALWQSQVSVLKNFPIANLKNDIGSLDHGQQTTVIVQIDADTRGEIFGAPWEIGPALVWMYPELKSDVESHRLNFLVGRAAEWLSVWDGAQVTQRWCNNKQAVVSTAKTRRVMYVRISADGYSPYDQYVPNLETGCSQIESQLR